MEFKRDSTRPSDWYNEKPWHIVRTQPMQETVFASHMVARGWPVYVPQEKRQYQRLGRPHFKTVALFPGYVFAHLLAGDEQVGLIRGLPGFLRMLTTGDRNAPYALLPSAFIAALTEQEFELSPAILKRGRFVGITKEHEGMQARILSGPFEGFYAQILKVEPDKRIKLLASLFGRPTEITMESGEIEVA